MSRENRGELVSETRRNRRGVYVVLAWVFLTVAVCVAVLYLYA